MFRRDPLRSSFSGLGVDKDLVDQTGLSKPPLQNQPRGYAFVRPIGKEIGDLTFDTGGVDSPHGAALRYGHTGSMVPPPYPRRKHSDDSICTFFLGKAQGLKFQNRLSIIGVAGRTKRA